MADDILAAVITPFFQNTLEHTNALIKDEYHLFQGVNEEVQKLSSNLSAIKATLKMAEINQIEDTHLSDWIRKLKNAVWDVEDVLETFRTDASLWKRKQEVRCFKPPFSLSKASYIYDAARRIKKVSDELKRIAEERKNFHINTNVDEIRPLRNMPICSSVETDVVFGREDDKKRLVDSLLLDTSDRQGKVSIFPIVGMGGLGKTTLARLVYNDSKVEQHFDLRMWVCVTVKFDLTQILRDMMEPYVERNILSNLSSSLMESHFRDFLFGKQFLLVLDDVWSVDYNNHWKPLLQLLEMGEIGSKVLVTTRNRKVADIVEAQPLYLLDFLPENECWSLFENIASRGGSSSNLAQDDLKDIGREIIRKCGGLPLAVKALGGLLHGNVDVRQWRKVMNSSIWELNDSNLLNILCTLKLSYYYLASHLKQCFAFCSIFPKGYSFDKEELVKLWLAEGFIQSSEQEREEKIGIEYFDNLLAMFFFQPANIGDKVRYGMHDIIHDLAQSVSSTYCCQVKDKDVKSCSFSKDFRHVSLLCQDVEDSSLKIVNTSSKLRTLLLPGDHVKDFGQALEKLFCTLKHIRMLDLSSSTLLQLPNSIKELKLLRYLDLSNTEIRVLPDSICNLYNLQTLKLLGCPRLFALPKELGKLINLHYLELDEMFWLKCKSLPPRLGKLTSLRNLTAFRVGCKAGYRIEELKDMTYLTGALHILMLENAVKAKEAKLNEKETLQKLVYEWSNSDNKQRDQADEEILEELVPHSNIKEIRICNYRGTGFPTWMRDGLLQNLVIVTLNHCVKSKTLSLGELPCLEVLNVKGLLELEEWPNVCYPSLDRLKVCDCPKLMKLSGVFHKLETLKIKRCNSLRVLPLTPCLKSLMAIDNHSLEGWNEAELPSQSEGEPSLRCKLAEVRIVNCPKLSALPRNFSP